MTNFQKCGIMIIVNEREVITMMLVKSISVVLMVAIGLAYIGLVVGCEIKGGR